MIFKTSQANDTITVFFPKEPAQKSPYEGRDWPSLRDELERLLQSDPSLIGGYNLSDAGGTWYDKKSAKWVPDAVAVISMCVGPEFRTGLKSPERVNPSKHFIAKLARMSCISMGQEEFFASIHSGVEQRATKDGLVLLKRDEPTSGKTVDECIPYGELLGGIHLPSDQ